MKIISPIAAIAVIMIIAVSCKKNTPAPVGGKGGKTTLLVTPEHHGAFVDSCTIYIKYATSDAPANGIYDDSARCILSDTTPVATFAGLTTGSYYIYGVGIHVGYVPPNVKGGLPVTIPNNDTLHIYLPTSQY